MTKRMTSLLNDARDAGYTVTHQTSGTIYVFKRVGRWEKPEGLVIYSDGTAYCVDVPLSSAKGIRKYNDMRHILRIKMEASA